MDAGTMGKEYADQEVVCQQGEIGNCMFVVLAGRLSVVREEAGREVTVGELQGGEVFGEMAIVDQGPRSATVRAKGNARVLTLDKRAFLKRVREDPTLAFRIIQQMSGRIRRLNDQLSRVEEQPAQPEEPAQPTQ